MQSSLLRTGVLAALIQAPPAAAAFLGCPQGAPTGAALEEWRQQAATALGDGSASEGTVADRLSSCYGDDVPACLQRLVNFVSRDDIAPPETDVTVYKAPQKQPPAELFGADSAAFTYVVPENIEQLAAARGWPSVRYKSRYSGGFDPVTPSLLMIYVPGDRVSPPVTYDRWLNIPLPADHGADALAPTPKTALPSAADYAAETRGGPALPRIMTMVTLERASKGQPGAVYFQRFYRAVPGSPKFTPEANADVGNCSTCHPNGLRAISPLGYHVRDGEAQLAPAEWKTVKAINTAMETSANHAVISWRSNLGTPGSDGPQPLLVPAGKGPIYGPLTPLNGRSRTKEFIMGGPDADGPAGCYKYRTTVAVVDLFGRDPGVNNVYQLSERPSIRWEKVRDAMACERCHNNVQRAAFNSGTDSTQLDFKILVDQSMPRGSHFDPMDQGSPSASVKDTLTPDERIALANCLHAEFQLEKHQLVKWLTQDACQ